jgi:hypothetical protein
LELRNEKKEVQQWGTRVRRESTITDNKSKNTKSKLYENYKSKCTFILKFIQELNLAQHQTGVTLQYFLQHFLQMGERAVRWKKVYIIYITLASHPAIEASPKLPMIAVFGEINVPRDPLAFYSQIKRHASNRSLTNT